MAFTKPNWRTITHSHVRELNSRQPSASSAKKFDVSMRSSLGSRMSAVKNAARKNVRRVDGDPDTGARRGHDEPAERGADDPAAVLAEAKDRVRALEHRPRDGLGDDAGGGGEEERRAHAVDRREDHQLPDLRVAQEQEQRDQALADAADHVRRHHHEVPRQPVGPDSADQEEDHLRHRPRGQDEAQVRLRAGELQDGEREGDVCERAADERRRPAQPEEPELALAQRAVAEIREEPHRRATLGRVPEPLEAVEDEIETKLETALFAVVGSRCCHDVLDEVGVLVGGELLEERLRHARELLLVLGREAQLLGRKAEDVALHDVIRVIREVLREARFPKRSQHPVPTSQPRGTARWRDIQRLLAHGWRKKASRVEIAL